MKKGLIYLVAMLIFAPLTAWATDPGITFQSIVPTGGATYELDISGNYAYVQDFYAGLQIFDISSPSSPELVGSLDITHGRYIDVAGSYAYVVSTSEGLKVIDISAPATPSLVGAYTDVTGDISVSGSYAYIGNGEEVKVIDISAPATPSLASTYSVSTINSLTVSGNYLYIGNGGSVLDIVNMKTCLSVCRKY